MYILKLEKHFGTSSYLKKQAHGDRVLCRKMLNQPQEAGFFRETFAISVRCLSCVLFLQTQDFNSVQREAWEGFLRQAWSKYIKLAFF